MSIKTKGMICTMLAAIIFGATPALGKLTYDMGNNGIQLAFLRHLFVLPIFVCLILYKKESFTLTKQQAIDLLKMVQTQSKIRAWEKPSDHVPLYIELNLDF